MKPTVVAAIDSSAAAGPVLEVARAFARCTGASVQALHVVEDGDETADAIAGSLGVAVRNVRGDVIERLAGAAASPDVAAMVLGVRGRPAGPRPAGHVAIEILTRAAKQVIVVPPDAAHPAQLRRVLVPTEGRPDGPTALAPIIQLLAGSGIEVAAVHVDDEATLPSYSDQIQHETEAFSREFTARNLPGAVDVDLTLRVGRPGAEVLAACDESTTDLVVVSWSRDLSPGRARVVRELLERSRVPVLLVPQRAPDE